MSEKRVVKGLPQASAVRDHVLLVYLSKLLSSIAGTLERFDDIGIDFPACAPSTLKAEMPRSAELAIKELQKLLYEDCWRCDLLASALFNVDLKRRSLIHLAEIRESICQADGSDAGAAGMRGEAQPT